jgi:hypothetical protein
MKVVLLLLLVLQIGSVPIFGQDKKDFFDKRESALEGRSELKFQAKLLKAKPDYLIVSNPAGEQLVIWVNRYATIRKKHTGFFNKTRKAYISELVPGTDAKVEAVYDEGGRLLLKRITVHDTIQEYEPDVPVVAESD